MAYRSRRGRSSGGRRRSQSRGYSRRSYRSMPRRGRARRSFSRGRGGSTVRLVIQQAPVSAGTNMLLTDQGMARPLSASESGPKRAKF